MGQSPFGDSPCPCRLYAPPPENTRLARRTVFEPGERGGVLRSLWRAATIAATTAALALPAAAHADGGQNMLHPESKQAHAIWTLWWVMLGVSAFGFAVIVFLLVLGW